MCLFVEGAANGLRAEVHHDVAVIGGDFATDVHGTALDGRVVADDAVFEGRLGIHKYIHACALCRCRIVADPAVVEVTTQTVENAATH